jgi:hypothetical protein
MTRTIGILVGALLMLAVFLLALSSGISPPPLPPAANNAADRPTQDSAQTQSVDKQPREIVDQPPPSAQDTARLDEATLPDPEVNGLTPPHESWNRSMADNEAPRHSNTMAMSRYPVWSPFRSEWAAQGFARRLTLATDVPVEVINAGADNYQVVFSYRDDSERQAIVTHIETVTGLELD